MKFIRRCVRQMHELRLDKHLKTKEVEMLALATINIISVDEKVENSKNLGAPFAREGVWLHFQCSLVQGQAGECLLVCKKSPITIPIVLRHTAAHGALHWGPDG